MSNNRYNTFSFALFLGHFIGINLLPGSAIFDIVQENQTFRINDSKTFRINDSKALRIND